MEMLKQDVSKKFEISKSTFLDAEGNEQESLQLFSFICQLSFDVYLKKQMIETLVDQLSMEEEPLSATEKRKR